MSHLKFFHIQTTDADDPEKSDAKLCFWMLLRMVSAAEFVDFFFIPSLA